MHERVRADFLATYGSVKERKELILDALQPRSDVSLHLLHVFESSSAHHSAMIALEEAQMEWLHDVHWLGVHRRIAYDLVGKVGVEGDRYIESGKTSQPCSEQVCEG